MSKLVAPARLINLRLAYARARSGSRYWQRVLPDVPQRRVGADVLQHVPIHTSTDLARLSEAVRVRDGVPDSVRFTGGTTGRRAPTYHETTGRLASILENTRVAPGEARGWLGLVPSAGTGGPDGSVAKHGLVRAPMKHRDGYLHAMDLLAREHAYPAFTPRVRTAMMPLPVLKRLIYVMREEGWDPASSDVRLLRTWGYHLSPGWRTWIAGAFPKAVVKTTYGFTEVSARAAECRECGAYHFGPDAIWEVVDPQRGTAIREGLGRIIVSSLSDRDTMLFRYAPGDMVVRTPGCALMGEAGFRFAGRERHMIDVENEGENVFPVWPVHVQEAVDTTHWIARSNAPRHRGFTTTEGDGHPKWRIRATHEGRRIAVELELQYDPRLFVDTWAIHRRNIRTALVASSPTPDLLQGRTGVVDIVGHPPRTLDDAEIFRC